MKLFIKRCLAFGLLLMIAAFTGDYVVTTKLRESKQGDYGVWNDLFDGNIDSDVIIHGSSIAWVQFNTYILEAELGKKVYNLGVDGYGFDMQYCRHLLLQRYNRMPSTIIHVLDYGTFDRAAYLWNDQQFLPYLKDTTIRYFTSHYIGFNYFDKAFPFVRYVGKINAFRQATKVLVGRNEPDRYKGFQGQQLTWNADLNNAMNSYPQRYYENVDSAMVKLFRNYIEDCRNKGIKLIFVYPPEYIEGQTFVENRESILSLFKKIAVEYNLMFLDYSVNSISSEKKYFYNTLHLNTLGADHFTKILCEDLKTNKLF